MGGLQRCDVASTCEIANCCRYKPNQASVAQLHRACCLCATLAACPSHTASLAFCVSCYRFGTMYNCTRPQGWLELRARCFHTLVTRVAVRNKLVAAFGAHIARLAGMTFVDRWWRWAAVPNTLCTKKPKPSARPSCAAQSIAR